MDKIGHLVVTKSLTGNMHKTHKAALLLGSILPDLLYTPIWKDIRGKRLLIK